MVLKALYLDTEQRMKVAQAIVAMKAEILQTVE
jgi:hypothetical protein